MKKIFLGLSLAGVIILTGVVGMSNLVFADTYNAQKVTLKNEEINLIKNGDFSDSGKHWLFNGMYTPDFPKGYAEVSSSSGPLSNAESFDVEPNTKYKLEFDIKADHVWTSQPHLDLIGNGSTVQFSQSLTSPREWTTFRYEYITPTHINKLSFSIYEQRMSAFVMDNVKFVKQDK
ncbi:carbohydrate binding domain-containing protein [Enterococcus faecalis]|uniref:carbohydrate binding domain-containing protein n=1 Tax=Enterococcus faecalis TaxID=1351 RepID=UPI003CC5E0C3